MKNSSQAGGSVFSWNNGPRTGGREGRDKESGPGAFATGPPGEKEKN